MKTTTREAAGSVAGGGEGPGREAPSPASTPGPATPVMRS